ncbi:unnamed protein product [marine sediment metagenome]|uniref:Uncharacterized protein n=1 Tax=marine sediment metagenome TaxID=412755 RepID=X1RLT1_9ZZZZ
MVQESDMSKLVWPEHGNTLAWLDRAKAIMDLLTRAGTMYLGFQAFERAAPGAGPSGAIVSQIAMRLATAENMVSGAAGVATLAGMGILNVMPEGTSPTTDGQTWIEALVQPWWPSYVDPLRPVEIPP